MSRIVVLILIALLPLRGWSAVSMSVGMAAVETVQESARQGTEHATMPDDCAMLGMHNGDHDTDNEDSVHGACHTCQLCMTLVAQDSPAISFSERVPSSLASALSHRYISADLFSASKPPIS